MKFIITDPQKSFGRTLEVSKHTGKVVSFQIDAARSATRMNEVNVVVLELLRALQAMFPELHIQFSETPDHD